MSELQISSIIAASSLVVFLASPRWGRLSDRWGRKRVMVLGLFGYACGNLLFASVFHATLIGLLLPLTGYLLLMLTRVMHASVMSAIMPSSSAYMADITSVATRTKGMGAVGAANNFGSILGPALGGLLAGITLLTPLWVASGVAITTALFVFSCCRISPRVHHRQTLTASEKTAEAQLLRPWDFALHNRRRTDVYGHGPQFSKPWPFAFRMCWGLMPSKPRKSLVSPWAAQRRRLWSAKSV